LLESILICQIGQNIGKKNFPRKANLIFIFLLSLGIFATQTRNIPKAAREKVSVDIKEITSFVEQLVINENASVTLDCCFNYIVPYYLTEESNYLFGQHFTYILKGTSPLKNHFVLRKDHYSINTLIRYAIADIYGSDKFCSKSMINSFGPYQLYKLECE
jgi:hypothetical protein